MNFWDDEDLGYFPDTVPRRCTDCCWIPIYFIALSLFASVCFFAATHHLIDRTPWLPRDYKWRACGEGENVGKEPLGSTDTSTKRRVGKYFSLVF